MLELNWQALAASAADYTVFVRVQHADEKIVAQYDGAPAGGALPTRAWPPGYAVTDVILAPLPSMLTAKFARCAPIVRVSSVFPN